MRRRTGAAVVLAATLALTSVTASLPAAGDPQNPSPGVSTALGAPAGPGGRALVNRTSYRNPVSRSFADTFADPAVIRAKDGWWYAFGTTDPLREGDRPREGEAAFRNLPIARSRDLVRWTYVGDAFRSPNQVSWAAPNARLWAPDIRYVNGQYRMYYVVTETTVTDEPNDNAIGMATAPTPSGPWTDSGAPVVGPRRGDSGNPGDFKWTFDPSVVTNTDGSQWMFYGSYYGGIFATRLTANGRRPVGTPTMVAIDNKFEGAYPIRRGGYWYLFASTANCCAGPTTGYSVHVGRSRSITGPYRDQQGVPLVASRAGGTPVLMQNGNRWIGAGHNAVATDLAGQDWIVYHALNRADPYLDEPGGINERPMLLDRLDWVNGWPYVRADRGPSDTRQPGPATRGRWSTNFQGGIPDRWRETGRWTTARERQARRYLTSRRAGTLTTRSALGSTVRVEADLRSSVARHGLQAQVGSATVQALINPARGTLTLRELRGRTLVRSRTAALPAGYAADEWHALALEIRHGVASANLSHARLNDPLAVATLRLSRPGSVRRAGVVAAGRGVDVDNLSALPAARLVTRLARDRVPNRLDAGASDEFNAQYARPGWTWVRRDDAATVTGGVLRWPTQAADLVGPGNDAAVLLRSPGTGSWTAETKVTIDLGTDTIRNFQQAGIIAYVNDDLFTRFSHVAIWNTRQTEFGKEMPFAGVGDHGLAFGGTIVGPPAETTWLRLTHRLDPNNGEHELRAWSSRDGRTWVKGGVWTLPANADVRVGLVSHGGAGATAQFDYFRLYRP